MIRLHRRDPGGTAVPAAGTDAGVAVLAEINAAESRLDRHPTLECVAEQARRLTGAATCWIAVPGADVQRAGPTADDAVARSLASGCLTDGLEQARGDLLALPGSAAGAAFALVLRFDEGLGQPLSLARTTCGWVAHRLRDLARQDQDERAARAELRALRAQISPHFTFNALGAIAATIRLDPEHARALLLGFADYTRYSFGRHGDYTTLAEELGAVQTYLALESARFGARLRTRVLVPPEVLGVSVPFLVLQPLVENAVRHGVEPMPGGGTIAVRAYEDPQHVRIEVEDDGPGMDPVQLEARLSANLPESERSGFGLRSVDERLRAVYGDAFGLVIETAPGAGTKVIVRLPKYRPEIHP